MYNEGRNIHDNSRCVFPPLAPSPSSVTTMWQRGLTFVPDHVWCIFNYTWTWYRVTPRLLLCSISLTNVNTHELYIFIIVTKDANYKRRREAREIGSAIAAFNSIWER